MQALRLTRLVADIDDSFFDPPTEVNGLETQRQSVRWTNIYRAPERGVARTSFGAAIVNEVQTHFTTRPEQVFMQRFAVDIGRGRCSFDPCPVAATSTGSGASATAAG